DLALQPSQRLPRRVFRLRAPDPTPALGASGPRTVRHRSRAAAWSNHELLRLRPPRALYDPSRTIANSDKSTLPVTGLALSLKNRHNPHPVPGLGTRDGSASAGWEEESKRQWLATCAEPSLSPSSAWSSSSRSSTTAPPTPMPSACAWS